MKVLFITSGQIGHMDFGGLGFVRLDETLRAQGHDTSWVSFSDQVLRLRNAGCRAQDIPGIAELALMPITSVDDIEAFQPHHLRRVAAMGDMLAMLRAARPDLIFIDRLLVCAGLAADQLGIPYVAVGTPGGYWRFNPDWKKRRVTVHPKTGPIDAYLEYGELLKRELGWTAGSLGSGWLRSSFCNLHFMGRSFYSDVGDAKTASIYHHSSGKAAPGDVRIAISFGNQGNTGRLKKLAEALIADRAAGTALSIIAGKDDQLFTHFTDLCRGMDVRMHRWVDFSVLMPGISHFVFLGGVGSIWHCIEHRIPMIAVPGHIGDQLENARRIATTGTGLHFSGDRQPGEIAATLRETIEKRPFDAGLSDFRSLDNYSDTMESFVTRATRLAF